MATLRPFTYKVPLAYPDVPLKSPSTGDIVYLSHKQTDIANAEGFFSLCFYVNNPIDPKNIQLLTKFKYYCMGIEFYSSICDIQSYLISTDSKIQEILKKIVVDKSQYYKVLVENSYAPEHRFPPFPIFANIFKNWKLLLYIDQFTIDYIQQINNDHPLYSYFQSILNDKNIILGLVTAPEHQRNTDIPKINGPFFRSLRFHSFFDFPEKFIFCRDADTTFNNTLQIQLDKLNTSKKPFEGFASLEPYFILHLYLWEEHYYNMYFLNDPAKLVLSTGPFNASRVYLAPWHLNEKLLRRPPFGFLAGYTSIGPQVPCRKNKEIWNSFLDYVFERSHPLYLNSEDIHKQKMNYQIEQYIRPKQQQLKNAEQSYGPNSEFKNNPAYQKHVEKKKEQFNTFINSYRKNQEKLLAKITEQSKINSVNKRNLKFTNDSDFVFNIFNVAYIGRDEQFLLFFLAPQCIDYVKIHYYNSSAVDRPEFLQKLEFDEMEKILLSAFKESMIKNFQYDPVNPDVANSKNLRTQLLKKFKNLEDYYNPNSYSAKRIKALNVYKKTLQSANKNKSNSQKGGQKKTRKRKLSRHF